MTPPPVLGCGWPGWPCGRGRMTPPLLGLGWLGCCWGCGAAPVPGRTFSV
jgi:hypothetical protein